MPKITMAEYGTLAASVLNLPRKTRDILEGALAKKRAAEDAAKANGAPAAPAGEAL